MSSVSWFLWRFTHRTAWFDLLWVLPQSGTDLPFIVWGVALYLSLPPFFSPQLNTCWEHHHCTLHHGNHFCNTQGACDIQTHGQQLNMGLVEHQCKQGCVPKQQLTARGALHVQHLLWMLFYGPLVRKGPWNQLISLLWLVRTHASCSSSFRMQYTGAKTELSLCPFCSKRLPATCV